MTTKPFYVKLFPSMLPIIPGECLVKNKKTGEITLSEEDTAYETKDFERVDKYLCARDLTLNVPYYFDPTKKQWHLGDDIQAVPLDYVPVLGLISPNNNWATQGEELNYEQVQPFVTKFIKDPNHGFRWLALGAISQEQYQKFPVDITEECEGNSVRAIRLKRYGTGEFL